MLDCTGADELFLASPILAACIADLLSRLIQHFIFLPCGETQGRSWENEGEAFAF